MYIVTVTNNGETFYLRGTVWAFNADRAFAYDNEPDARVALARARPFMAAKIYKAAQIIEVI
tara:strand:- start:255 stop:440 length:186 start_codon:yes stop_codon:yes gene_type:complete